MTVKEWKESFDGEWCDWVCLGGQYWLIVLVMFRFNIDLITFSCKLRENIISKVKLSDRESELIIDDNINCNSINIIDL